MILITTIVLIVHTKRDDMFPTTGISIDMFPHTDGILDMFYHMGDIHSGVSGHVESIALLQRVSNTRKASSITLDVDMNDYYRIRNIKDNSQNKPKEVPGKV